MYLTLEVVSPQAASLGVDRRRVVSERGLTIGRVAGNDWVIPDPYISKQHARISYSNGSFFVESLGRNAIAIGSPANAMPGNQPRPLRNGDRLFIDQYEMIVTTQQGDPPGKSQADYDPFAVLPAVPGSSNVASAGTIPDVWNGGAAGELMETGVMDPLAVLPGGRPPQPDSPPPVHWERASALEGHFEPPPVRSPAGSSPFELLESAPESPAPAPAQGGIPDNWDRTNLPFREAPPAKASPPRPVTPAPGARNAYRDPPVSRPVKPEPSRPEPVRREVPRRDVRNAASEPPQRTADVQRPASDSRRLVPQPRELPATGLTELLRGAGLPENEISPEVIEELGKVLRVVVEGVMEVLRARAQIKSQFRMPTTRIQSAENNPLKHSPNVESALHTLLVQKNPGFLSTVQAFEDAFADIRNHQMAMLEGVRVAFDSMLESFDPKELEKGFERPAKRGFGSAKSKYWDLYVERFARLGGDADDTFRRLFGDMFAEAYEKQLERLKTLPRNSGKT